MRGMLGESVSKVVVSTRLTDVPAALTTVGPVSLEMEKVLSRMPDGQGARSERVLELNASHRVFGSLKKAYDEGDDKRLRLYTDLLYNQALLIEGVPIEDPMAFAEQISQLM